MSECVMSPLTPVLQKYSRTDSQRSAVMPQQGDLMNLQMCGSKELLLIFSGNGKKTVRVVDKGSKDKEKNRQAGSCK